jgi:hypothetical protein
VDRAILEAYLRRGLSLETIGRLTGRHPSTFHHRDGAAKAFGLGGRGLTRSLDAVRAEAAKCVLLCGNCHSKIEAGIVKLG